MNQRDTSSLVWRDCTSLPSANATETVVADAAGWWKHLCVPFAAAMFAAESAAGFRPSQYWQKDSSTIIITRYWPQGRRITLAEARRLALQDIDRAQAKRLRIAEEEARRMHSIEGWL